MAPQPPPWTYEPLDCLRPTGNDDTLAIQQSAQEGYPLGPGVFQISDLISLPAGAQLRGAGAARTTIRAIAPGAGIRYGGGVGSAPQQQQGVHGGYAIDGAAVATVPLLVANCVGATFLDLLVQNGLGDGAQVLGQNNTFVGFGAGGSLVDLVLDNGAGGNLFLKPELHGGARTSHNLEFRCSAAPAPGSYPVPQSNFFYGGICEFNLNGCVQQLAGAFNYFEQFNFFTNALYPLVSMLPNTVPGRSNDLNGALHFTDCTWTGNYPGSVLSQFGIWASSVSGGVAQPLPADRGVVLDGENVFSGLAAALWWEVNSPIYLNGPQPQLYNTAGGLFAAVTATGAPIWFAREGDTGWFPALTNGWTQMRQVKVYRDRGRTYLSGMVGAGTNGLSAFDLSTVPGYKPGGDCQFATDGGGAVTVTATGQVIPTAGAIIALDGISFEHTTYA